MRLLKRDGPSISDDNGSAPRHQGTAGCQVLTSPALPIRNQGSVLIPGMGMLLEARTAHVPATVGWLLMQLHAGFAEGSWRAPLRKGGGRGCAFSFPGTSGQGEPPDKPQRAAPAQELTTPPARRASDAETPPGNKGRGPDPRARPCRQRNRRLAEAPRSRGCPRSALRDARRRRGRLVPPALQGSGNGREQRRRQRGGRCPGGARRARSRTRRGGGAGGEERASLAYPPKHADVTVQQAGAPVPPRPRSSGGPAPGTGGTGRAEARPEPSTPPPCRLLRPSRPGALRVARCSALGAGAGGVAPPPARPKARRRVRTPRRRRQNDAPKPPPPRCLVPRRRPRPAGPQGTLPRPRRPQGEGGPRARPAAAAHGPGGCCCRRAPSRAEPRPPAFRPLPSPRGSPGVRGTRRGTRRGSLGGGWRAGGLGSAPRSVGRQGARAVCGRSGTCALLRRRRGV